MQQDWDTVIIRGKAKPKPKPESKKQSATKALQSGGSVTSVRKVKPTTHTTSSTRKLDSIGTDAEPEIVKRKQPRHKHARKQEREASVLMNGWCTFHNRQGDEPDSVAAHPAGAAAEGLDTKGAGCKDLREAAGCQRLRGRQRHPEPRSSRQDGACAGRQAPRQALSTTRHTHAHAQSRTTTIKCNAAARMTKATSKVQSPPAFYFIFLRAPKVLERASEQSYEHAKCFWQRQSFSPWFVDSVHAPNALTPITQNFYETSTGSARVLARERLFGEPWAARHRKARRFKS